MFTEDELRILDAISAGKKLGEDDKEALAALKEKVGATSQAHLLERFIALTGWTNRPKEYSL